MAFYLLDKTKGNTSNFSLKKFKSELNIRKAGFSGVLDPFATGLLIIATDGDTRFLDMFLKSRKTYIGKILFGKTTDTLDIDGAITEEKESKITLDEINEIISKKFTGWIKQTPPKFSNIKVNGKRAHELARENKEFNLDEVEREVFKFNITNFSNNEATFEVEVSSGTYVRSLAKDLGECLDVPAMLIELRRTKIGDLELPKNELTEISRKDIIPFKFVSLDEKLIKDLLDGKFINIEEKENDIIVNGDKDVLWIKGYCSKYKIHKRIE